MDNNHEQKQNTSIIIFGVVAVAALAIAWFAFNRSGQDLAPTVVEEAGEAYQATEDAAVTTAANIEAGAEMVAEETTLVAARAEARADLAALEVRVAAEEGYENAAQEVAAIEANLEAAYANASVEAQEAWVETRTMFDELEDGLRDGTGDVLEVLGGLTLMLEEDVRYDEDEKEMNDSE